jgi:ligand-binding sensor domain-containing protein
MTNLQCTKVTVSTVYSPQPKLAIRTALWLAFVMLATSGCKKEEIDGQPPQTESKWVLYQAANSSLADNQVNALVIDPNDVKWVGTANGLVRISGDSWTVFNTGNSDLPSAFIQALAVEENGTVWVGTNQGLARYNQSGWALYTSANSALADNAIMCLTHDPKSKRTWIGTAKGLVSLDSNQAWQRYDETEDDLILSMAVDQAGGLWLGTFNTFAFRGQLKWLAGQQWTTFQLDQLGYASTFPYALAIDRHNAVVAVLSGTSVRSVIRRAGSGWQEVPGPQAASGLRALLLEGDGIWVGGRTLSRFGKGEWQSLPIPGTDSGILSMAMDSQGRKWLGTFQGGLAVYNPSGK